MHRNVNVHPEPRPATAFGATVNTFLREHRRHRALSAERARPPSSTSTPSRSCAGSAANACPAPDTSRALASALELETAAVAGFFDEARPALDAGCRVPRGMGCEPPRRGPASPCAELALRLDVLPATVYNWEAGRARIPAAHAPGPRRVAGHRRPARPVDALRCAPVAHARTSCPSCAGSVGVRACRRRRSPPASARPGTGSGRGNEARSRRSGPSGGWRRCTASRSPASRGPPGSPRPLCSTRGPGRRATSRVPWWRCASGAA